MLGAGEPVALVLHKVWEFIFLGAHLVHVHDALQLVTAHAVGGVFVSAALLGIHSDFVIGFYALGDRFKRCLGCASIARSGFGGAVAPADPLVLSGHLDSLASGRLEEVFPVEIQDLSVFDDLVEEEDVLDPAAAVGVHHEFVCIFSLVELIDIA